MSFQVSFEKMNHRPTVIKFPQLRDKKRFLFTFVAKENQASKAILQPLNLFKFVQEKTRRMLSSISSGGLNVEGEAEESTRFQNALLELKGLRSQLHQAADYCESTFLRTKEKNEVVGNTKEYLCRAMVTVVDHLGSVTSKLESSISQTNAFNDVELRLNCLNQRLLSCKEYSQMLELSRLRWSENLPRHHPRYILPVSKHAEKLNRSSSMNQCRDSNDLLFAKTVGNCKLDIFTEKPMPVLLYKFYTYNLPPSKALSHRFTSSKDDKDKTTLQKAILAAGDEFSVRSKDPNSTFYFQVSQQKPRHRRSKFGSGIFSFIRTKQIA